MRSSHGNCFLLIVGLFFVFQMQKAHLADKLEATNVTLQKTRDAAIEEQGVTLQKLNQMTLKNRELQKWIEKDISGRYQNRKVNVMGGVQSL